jgi:MFS family permease
VTRRAGLALLGGALILTLAMGVRQTFGLILTPMGTDLGIGREAFGLALAVQNLLWGAAQPFAGALADRWGAVRVAAVGSLLYAGGLVAMATAADAGELLFGAGVLVGLGLSGVSFAVVLGAVGRAVPADKRSLALGVASAGGSFGQFVMAPVGHALISGQGWAGALMTMAAIALVMAPLALLLAEKGGAGAAAHPGPASAEPVRAVAALSEAGGHRGFWCLTLGFFVCGFQVVFIGVHLPPYLNDLGLAPILGAYALALIGFFNIIGTWGAGVLGGRFSKKYLLSALYALRAAAIAVFLVLPKTPAVVLAFASVIGLLWLGTVPLTSGLVAQIFGVRHLSMLFGLVFFSHQAGSFLGVWLGGVVFDRTGSYDPIWLASVVLGLIAALLHLPIAEQPSGRGVATAAA